MIYTLRLWKHPVVNKKVTNNCTKGKSYLFVATDIIAATQFFDRHKMSNFSMNIKISHYY